MQSLLAIERSLEEAGGAGIVNQSSLMSSSKVCALSSGQFSGGPWHAWSAAYAYLHRCLLLGWRSLTQNDIMTVRVLAARTVSRRPGIGVKVEDIKYRSENENNDENRLIFCGYFAKYFISHDNLWCVFFFSKSREWLNKQNVSRSRLKQVHEMMLTLGLVLWWIFSAYFYCLIF